MIRRILHVLAAAWFVVVGFEPWLGPAIAAPTTQPVAATQPTTQPQATTAPTPIGITEPEHPPTQDMALDEGATPVTESSTVGANRSADIGPIDSAGDPNELGVIRRRLDRLASSLLSITSGVEPDPQDVEAVDAIAQRVLRLTEELSKPSDRVEAGSIALQAYHVLTRLAQQTQNARELAYRVGQLRSTAWKTKRLPGASAVVVGDFWLLLADLIDINRTGLGIDTSQQQAIQRLERFLRDYLPTRTLGTKAQVVFSDTDATIDPAMGGEHLEILRDVRLGLLELYDQRGMTRQACRLIHEIHRDLPPGDTRTTGYLASTFGYCSLLGQRFEAQLQTVRHGVWSSEDYQGQPMLIHLWADWVGPSRVFEELRSVYASYQPRGLAMISVNVYADHTATQPGVDWPVCMQSPEDEGLRRLFMIHSLPRFILLDPKGRVASVASSLAILDQVESMLTLTQDPPEGLSIPHPVEDPPTPDNPDSDESSPSTQPAPHDPPPLVGTTDSPPASKD